MGKRRDSPNLHSRGSIPMAQGTLWRDLHWPHFLLLALLIPAASQINTESPERVVVAWLVLNFALLAMAERFRPQRASWRPTQADLVRDGGVFALNTLVDMALKTGVAIVVATLATPRMHGVPLPAQWMLGLLLAELGSYAMHRWSHRGGCLWHIHALHHRPAAMNVANALTAHPINALYDGTVRLAPLGLLGFEPAVIVALAMFHLTQALVAHANVRGHIGPLRSLLGNAEAHRLHHSTRADEAGNFGTDVLIWDRIFGTFRDGKAPENVGVFSPTEYPNATATRQWLMFPFRCVISP